MKKDIRMKTVVVTLMILIPVASHAQDTAKAPPYGWHHGIVAALTATQVSYTDWAQGGDNALAYALSLDGKSVNDAMTTNWSNSYKFAFGQARLGSQGLRKTDDRIALETVFMYKLNSYVNPYASATLLTQFVTGYKYDAAGGKTAVSKFFDPGYLTQTAGVGFSPTPEVKTRLGAGLREIITSEFPSYADDPKTVAIEKTSVKGGLESVTDIEWHLDDNLLFTAKLEMFAPFITLDQIVVRSGNTLVAKVNKYVTVNLDVQLINERQVTPRTQVKETLAIGFSYALL